MVHDPRGAVAARRAADGRVRRLTTATAAVGVAATAVFASLAAGSTHLRKVVVVQRHRRAATTLAPVRVPPPPLVSVEGAASAPAPPPAPAPSAVQQSPVVVSGGS